MHNRKLWKEAQKNTEKSRKSASFLYGKNAGYRRERQYFSEFCDIKEKKCRKISYESEVK